MNILITGGAGYVGYSASRALARKYPKATIVIHDNLSKGRLENISLLKRECPNIALVPWERADIRDYAKFEAVLDEYKPEVIVHLAAIVDAFTTNRAGKDIECHIVNHEAAVKVAELAKAHGVKTFVYQSTVSMYSRGEGLTEDAPKEPLSAYGISKYEAEQKILAMSDSKFCATALRSATIVGYNPSFRYETIINMLCIRSVYGMETTVFESALKNPKTYLTLDDEAAAILFAIEHIERMKGEAYNVTSFNTALEEVIKALEATGTKPLVRIGGEKTINQQVYTINSDKIRKLGFIASGNVRDTVRTTVEGLRKKKDAAEKIA
ncbi:NAD(P)-dependent oxidoreductase [Candidatus Parcubacteria bacterium]|nr:NAD(P)-dependent oxidoreductase [Candidatus Parcubacteria bacterium]